MTMNPSILITVMPRNVKHHQEVRGRWIDVSKFSETEVGGILEGLADILKDIKKINFFSLDCGEAGTVLFHPDDISHITVRGTTPELNALIQEYI